MVNMFLRFERSCTRDRAKNRLMPLYQNAEYTLHADRVEQNEFLAEALSATHLRSNYGATLHHDRDPRTEWRLAEDVPPGPTYTSDQPLVDALFSLAREEAHRNVEADGTLRTGAKWAGVWTRDVSYSALLAFAIHNPEAVKTSLRKKVSHHGRIVQDTGTGGAWPVSSDRTTWAMAAWEVYRCTGDRDWLEEVYPIIKATLDDDRKTLLDPATGLFRGESSFLDWREQTYPRWMNPTDIYNSLCLGTNVVHYRSHRILVEMAELLGKPAEGYGETADRIKTGINERLWLLDKGYYGQFMYGRGGAMIVSPRFEALGEALAILNGVTDRDRAATIMERGPLTPFGVSCIYPQIPDMPPYHNNAVWPFVQAFWNLAAARVGNGAALSHGMGALYRAAALFLSNYENMVTETGGVTGTHVNSHRMLWSIAGNLAMVYRVLIGMDLRPDGLHFAPVIPEAFGGERRLSDFRYRGAEIDVTVRGYGKKIESVTLNGAPTERAFVPGDATGKQTLVITLADEKLPYQKINLTPNRQSLPTLWAGRVGERLRWGKVVGAARYTIYRDGLPHAETEYTQHTIPTDAPAVYQVAAIDAHDHEAFAGEPVVVSPHERHFDLGRKELTLANPNHTFDVEVERAGVYSVAFRYANGSGPVNTDNKCAIRTLSVGRAVGNTPPLEGPGEGGAVIFPQLGADDWEKLSYSNALRVPLEAGKNTLRLHFEEWNHNMDGEVNRVVVHSVAVSQPVSLG